jgi:hypothetical protein
MEALDIVANVTAYIYDVRGVADLVDIEEELRRKISIHQAQGLPH